MNAVLDYQGATRLLDVRGLEAPEPMIRILETLDTLGEDERLRVMIDREPVPLYHVLKRCGFDHRSTARDLLYEVLIWLTPDEVRDEAAL